MNPTPVAAPRLVMLNDELARELGLDADALRSEHGVEVLAGTSWLRGPSPWRKPMPATVWDLRLSLGDGRATAG